jgi:hypothetical protein
VSAEHDAVQVTASYLYLGWYVILKDIQGTVWDLGGWTESSLFLEFWSPSAANGRGRRRRGRGFGHDGCCWRRGGGGDWYWWWGRVGGSGSHRLRGI